MKRIVFPDRLVWQAGIEYGLQAVAEVMKEYPDIKCYINKTGPFLEAAAFAVYQFGLGKNTLFIEHPGKSISPSDIIIFPRVKQMEQTPIRTSLVSGKNVLVSDPSISFQDPKLQIFPRRDWKELSRIMLDILKDKE